MSKRNDKFLLEDIIQSIIKIERYTLGLDLNAFSSNELVIDAVVRYFQIIGEAANRLSPEITSQYP